MYKIVHVTLTIWREYSGLDSLGELGRVGEEGIELIVGPSIKCVPIVFPGAKEKKTKVISQLNAVLQLYQHMGCLSYVKGCVTNI